MALVDILDGKEWYDNSRLSIIDACLRKAFNNLLYAGQGLAAPVGGGALFGTCMHGFEAMYYSWWGKEPEEKRRLRGMRKFLELHEQLFVGPQADFVESKHTKETGLAIIDHYCDSYLAEDQLLRPIKLELAGAVEIKYDPALDGDAPFKSFWYAFKIDGLHLRVNFGDYWVREAKHTGGGVKRELVKLRLSHQPRGYVYCARQFPGPPVTGCMPDVVGVLVKTRECQRDFYPYKHGEILSWRRQVINKVQDWRAVQQRAKGLSFEKMLDVFYQRTSECTSYGLCAFYDLCRDGYSPATLTAFRVNTWNPLTDQVHLERKEITTPSGFIEELEVTP